MPLWPAALPQRPLIEGYDEALPDLVARSQPDVGWAKTRRRATAGPTRIAAAYRMTTAQRTIFEAFLALDLEGGTQAFDWPRPPGGAPVPVRLAAAPRVASARGPGRWTISLTLETMP
jgi:hypothetical protein